MHEIRAGYGDSETWPPCSGHPNDPRTKELDEDELVRLDDDRNGRIDTDAMDRYDDDEIDFGNR